MTSPPRPPWKTARKRAIFEMFTEELMPPPAPVTLPVDILRFNTCGSVDDGKSTLIGRLLYDS